MVDINPDKKPGSAIEKLKKLFTVNKQSDSNSIRTNLSNSDKDTSIFNLANYNVFDEKREVDLFGRIKDSDTFNFGEEEDSEQRYNYLIDKLELYDDKYMYLSDIRLYGDNENAEEVIREVIGKTEKADKTKKTDSTEEEQAPSATTASVETTEPDASIPNEKTGVDEVEETSTADIEKNVKLLEELNEKYNLNIDFNEELTDEQLELLQQAYFIDIQTKTLDSTEQSMLDYFDTLGAIDSVYDALKGLFGSDVTKEKVQEYYENERQKNDLLVSIVKNGGSIPLDAETKALLTRLMGDEGAAAAAEIDLLHADSLSFKDAYKILKGVEFDPDKISKVMESQDSYALVSTEYQNAVAIENMMANSSPHDILEYFNKLAEGQEGVTGEDLFNQYYKTFFEKYPDKIINEDINGLSCTGISVKDGYLWQEMAFPEGYSEADMENFAKENFMYKVVDENGNVKYYKVVQLDENENYTHVKCNMFPEDGREDYELSPMLTEGIMTSFARTNKSILENNLYLEKTKEDYDEVYGEGAFDTILDEFPKMYEEAFGKNELLDKLSEYANDMDGYSRTISQVLSIGCFAASFIPGLQIAAWVPLAIAATDNAIDLVNLATNNKDGEIGQWAADTLLEAGMIAIGMGINKFASKMGYKFTANQINNGNAFIMAHAKGVEAIVEYTVDNIASVIWDTAKGIFDGSLINEDGSFNWDYFQKMLVSDMIFNTADLRNGMSLYKSIAGNSVDVADGVKFTIDPDSAEVKFTYKDGYEITIGKDGKAVLSNPDTGENVELTFNKSTKSWETPDGQKIDLTESDPSLTKIQGNTNGDDIDIKTKLENDDELINNPELKQKVDELLENETIKKFVDEGFLNEYNLKTIAKGGDDVLNNALKLLNDEDVLKLIEDEKVNGNCIISMAKDVEAFDEVYSYLKNEKIYDLIANDKLLFIDFLEMRDDGNIDCYEKLLKIVESDIYASGKIKSLDLYDLVQLDVNSLDRYIKILSDNTNQGIFENFNISEKDVLKLAELSDAEFNKFIDIMTGTDYNSKFIQKLFRNNPDFDIQKLTNVSQMSDSEIERLVDLIQKDKSILATGKTKNITEISDENYDIVNKLFHGKRLDSSLEDFSVKVGGHDVAISFDNNMVTEEYLKAHPDFKIDASKTTVVTQEMLDSINEAIQKIIDAGLEVPKNIRISDLFAPDSRLSDCTAAGYFSQEHPNSVYINSEELSNADFLKEVIIHESAHMNDFNGKGYYSDDSVYKIDKQFSTDGLTADDISELVSDYSLTNNQEFVAEVSVLITNGTIVYNKNTGKYEINGSEYAKAHGGKVKVTPEVIEKINKIMEIYNEMTKGKVAKAKEI